MLSMASESGRHLAIYLVALVMFGTNGIVASYISLESCQIVFFRTMAGSVLLVAVFLFIHRRYRAFRMPKQAAMVALSGAFMGASWLFQYEAYREIGIGMTSLVYCCGPAALMALSPFLFGERMTAYRAVGFGIVVTGAVLLALNGAGVGGSPYGYFCAIMTAATYAMLIIFNKKATEVRGLENASLQILFAFLTVAVFVTASGRLPDSVPTDDILPILVLGLVNTGLGCLAYFTAIKHLPTQTVAICDYIEPMSAVIFAMALLNETMSPMEWIGAGLIAVGVIIGEAIGGRAQRSEGPSDGPDPAHHF